MSIESNHWYDRAGRPAYEVPNKSCGGMRSTTLRDARALGLVPSVTTVLKVAPKEALEAWKRKQCVLAALTLPRIEGESEDDLMRRIEQDAGAQAKAAAEEGNRIHDAIERSFAGQVVPEVYREHVAATHTELARLFPHVDDWVSEQSFAHESGFGGRVDLHSPSTGIVVDFKGKDFGPDDERKFNHDQHWQLGGYRLGLRLRPGAVGANIFVSRTHPGLVHGHVWRAEEIDEGEHMFLACLTFWKAIKRFDPGFASIAVAA
jgi:hypothetical protein